MKVDESIKTVAMGNCPQSLVDGERGGMNTVLNKDRVTNRDLKLGPHGSVVLVGFRTIKTWVFPSGQ